METLDTVGLHLVRSGTNFEAALFVAFAALVLTVLVAIQGSQPVLRLLALALAVAQTPQELAFLFRARLVVFVLVLELLGRLATFVDDILGRHGWWNLRCASSLLKFGLRGHNQLQLNTV